MSPSRKYRPLHEGLANGSFQPLTVWPTDGKFRRNSENCHRLNCKFEAVQGLLALDVDADYLRLVGQVRRLHRLRRGSGRIANAVGLQEARHY
jgi:hypothetical protein